MIPVNISMVCNHCKNLLEETYTPAILLQYYCIAREISTNNYQQLPRYIGIKYCDLCFQEGKKLLSRQ